MDNSSLIVGLDIGTTNVKAVVADASSDQLRIIGSASVPTAGMDHGNIVDIDQTANAIATVLSNVEEKTNTKINRIVTGIPVSMLQLENASGVVNVSDVAREITDQDVQHVTATALTAGVHDGREVITFLPTKFRVDNEDKIIDPRKMIGMSLEVKGILLTAPKAALHNIKKAIERAGYVNNFFVAAPLAVADVALDEGEQKFGTILLDIGGGQTTATVIRDGKITYATVDLEAGDDITRDISTVLNTSIAEAEKVKIDFGVADPTKAKEDNQVPVSVVGKETPSQITEEYLSEIIFARLEQVLSRIGRGLDSHKAFDLPGGIVITGGTSALPGLDQLVADTYQVNARIYTPDQMGLRDARYATGYGIVNYAYDLHDIDFLVNSVVNSNTLNVTAAKKINNDSENSKFFKRLQQSNETKPKEDYNSNKTRQSVTRLHENSEQQKTEPQPTNKIKKRRVKDLLKKFFD